MKIEKICKSCGKKFFVFPYNINRAKYCSKKCFFASKIGTIPPYIKKKGLILKICRTCNKEFLVYPYRKNSAKYCSQKCIRMGKSPWNKKIKIQKICSNCKKLFWTLPKKKKERRYCSKVCYTNSQIGSRRISKKSEKICKTCKEIFSVYPYRKNNALFCSSLCFHTKRRWLLKNDPNFLKQMGTKLEIPNKGEKFLELIIKKENLPYKFVGNGEFILAGKNPDFLNINGQKKIIELAGEHWHTPEQMGKRKELFESYGYKTLIIWYSELKNINLVQEKLRRFEYEI